MAPSAVVAQVSEHSPAAAPARSLRRRLRGARAPDAHTLAADRAIAKRASSASSPPTREAPSAISPEA
jgi:hypothetical protein